MASLSIPPAFSADLTSPFDSLPDFRPSTSTSHKRKHSRNPSAAPLPAFSFNPGAESDHSVQPDLEVSSTDMAAQVPSRRAQRPPPLPNFSFNPGAELLSDLTPSPTHPILEEMAANQQRTSRSARPAPLPAFTFVPGGSQSPQRSPSPTKSTFGEVQPSLRSGGHRRGGSEFVGGTELVNTSPQKGELRPQGPPVSGFNSRGHAHRRSQAISVSEIDTSELIKANAIAKHRAGSPPSTPGESPPQFLTQSPQRQSMSQISTRSPTASPRRRGSAPGIRPRVGFSETVDVIPRPLSLISSETDGSTSTIRGNHSLSGSINSVAASPNTRISQAFSPMGTDISHPRRPVTADPVSFGFGHTTLTEQPSVVNLPKRPLSASGSPAVTSSGSPPNKKKHFWFSHSAETSPSPSPKTERQNPMSDLPTFLSDRVEQPVRPKTSPERSASIKKRKVRSWTNGIFSRKGRPRSAKSKSRRTPTPPLSRRASDQLNEIFDADNTVVIQNSPSPNPRRCSAPASQILVTQPVLRQLPMEDRVTSPVIDLDAAFGQFGGEERSNEGGSRGAAARIAKLHSAERRGSADAFGTFHRRAESAPQMAPMHRSTFGVHHVGSNVSLSQDVFDEEEEDEFLAGEKGEASPSSDVSVSPQPDTPSKRPASAQQHSRDGLGLSVGSAVTDDVVIVDAEEEYARDGARSSNSTLDARNLPEVDVLKRPATSPMDFTYPAQRMNYASSTEGRTATNSLISSPDPEHVSFDEQPRFNRYLGEPSPEVGLRASNDDLPSLTDSVSTGNLPRFSSSANTRSSVEQRSASVSGPILHKPNNAWKRASLASLNRLIPGSSNGSKLKLEVMPEPVEDEQTKKKTNRISKLMHFWRAKEKA